MSSGAWPPDLMDSRALVEALNALALHARSTMSFRLQGTNQEAA